MTIIITGSNGFTGYNLAEFIVAQNYASQIVGIDIQDINTNEYITNYFSTSQFQDFFNYCFYLTDDVKFFHAGGLVGANELSILIENNVTWTAKFLHAASQIKNLAAFLNIGSSAEYGSQDMECISEITIPNPVTNYGISKHLQTELVLRYSKTHNIKANCTRTFNLTGPRISDKLFPGRLFHELSLFKSGEKEFIEIGNTNSYRDYIDIRDAVRIYWKLSELDTYSGIYNVGSGKKYKIQEIFDIMYNLLEIKKDPIIRKINSANPQTDIPSQFADLNKLQKEIELSYGYSLEDSIRDIIQAYAE